VTDPTDMPANDMPADDMPSADTDPESWFALDVIAQASEIAELDAARAEAWASDVLALAAEEGVATEAFFDMLREVGGDGAATALAALAGLHDEVPRLDWSAESPEWVDAIGTARCEGAWELRSRGDESLAFRFVDSADVRHVIMVDMLSGVPETVGEVIVGPGDMLDALQEEDAEIESEAGDLVALAARCVAALAATGHPAVSAVANGRLLLRRLTQLTDTAVPPPVLIEDEIPAAPERDPEDDGYALDIVRRALGAQISDGAGSEHGVAVDRVAALVAPRDLAPLQPAERDAVMILEWADWLGAVIGLVRAGEGCVVDGAAMVDFINRCPEVTTTIPKADRPRIEWAFEIMLDPWHELGLLDAEGLLTAAAIHVLPAALIRAWS